VSELKATVAAVHGAGLLDELLDNENLLGMLAAIGREFGNPQGISQDFLLRVLQDLEILPRSLEDAFRIDDDVEIFAELQAVAAAATTFVRQGLSDVAMLLTDPGQLVEAVHQVLLLAWTYVKATRFRDPEALKTLIVLLSHVGNEVVQAVRGLEVLQEATNPLKPGATAELARKLRWALVLEMASWFVGIGEVRAALKSVQAVRTSAAAGRFVATARRLGMVIPP
jgi:hypothetical protein